MAASLGLVGSLVPRLSCRQGYLVGIALNQGERMKGKEQVSTEKERINLRTVSLPDFDGINCPTIESVNRFT